MRFTFLIVVGLLIAPVSAYAKDNVTIQVMDSGAKAHVTRGLFHKEKTYVKDTLEAVVRNQNVLLECAEDNCPSLAPGRYDGRVHGLTVRIAYTLPLTTKTRHADYNIVGSWTPQVRWVNGVPYCGNEVAGADEKTGDAVCPDK